MTKLHVLLLVLGLVIGFGGSSLYNDSKIQSYQEEIKRLGQITDQLKGRLSQIENKEDVIKEEVEREQANKTQAEILSYWTSAYKLRHGVKQPSPKR